MNSATNRRRRQPDKPPVRPGRIAIELEPVLSARLAGVPESVLVRREMARSLALLFAAGGSLSLSTLLFPHWVGLNAGGVAAPGAIAVLVAVALWRLGPRLPVGAFHVVLALGTGCIATAVHFGGDSAQAVYSPYFVWVALYAFFFFTGKGAWAHLLLAAGTFLTELILSHSVAPGPVFVVTMGTATMTGVVVTVLVRRVRELALTDPMTGLANRRAWNDALSRGIDRAQRRHTPLTVAMLDLDGLKQINDSLGHGAGDTAIISATMAWTRHLRTGDLLARLGGDEFGLLLPNCTADEAHALVERIRTGANQPVSCGIASLAPDETAASITERADRALNEAKQQGRDQIVRSALPV